VIDFLYIAGNPADEPCVSVTPDALYGDAMKMECKLFMEAIRRKLGPEPAGCQLRMKRESHDFGDYYEVICRYDDQNDEAIAYAYKAESESPATWAEVGMSVTHRKVGGVIELVYDVGVWNDDIAAKMQAKFQKQAEVKRLKDLYDDDRESEIRRKSWEAARGEYAAACTALDAAITAEKAAKAERERVQRTQDAIAELDQGLARISGTMTVGAAMAHAISSRLAV
jgi:hypothetical protein